MIRRSLVCLWASLAIQAGCGGGGGGGGGAAPSPAPSPAQPSLPSIDSTATRIAEFTGSCPVGGCFWVRDVSLDANGEFTAFWVERPPGGGSSVRAANGNLVSGGVLSQVIVEPSFTGTRDVFQPVGARSFLYLNDVGPAPPGGQTRSRLVTFAGSGQASVSPFVDTPQTTLDLGRPIVRDVQGRLHGLRSGTTAPFPTAMLAGNVAITLVSPVAPAFSSISMQTVEEFDSIAPLALWAILGQETAGDVLSIYVNFLSLTDGTFSPAGFTKVSNQAVVATGVTGRVCSTGPVIRSTANAEFLVHWLQQNASLTGCDLWVNGARINAGTIDVVDHAVSGRAGELHVAVWREAEAPPGLASRLRFSRHDSLGSAWSAPAAIDATLDSARVQLVVPITAGPGGTLAVVWDHQCDFTDPTCVPTERRVSKYAGGTWTTKTISRTVSIVGVAINAAGEGVLLTIGTQCGATTCSELSAYRF